MSLSTGATRATGTSGLRESLVDPSIGHQLTKNARERALLLERAGRSQPS